MTDILEVSNNIRGLNVGSAEAQLRRLAVINDQIENDPSLHALEYLELCSERDAILDKWLD